MITPPILFRNLTLAVAGALFCATAALAAGAGASADAQARYRQDMTVCNSGQSNQDVATCRLEAKNAMAEAKRGGLNDAPDQYQLNALRRCAVHQDVDDLTACKARMRVEVRGDGSAESGGIYRESTTILPAR